MKKTKPKNDFSPFRVGTVFNPFREKITGVKPKYKSVTISYPSRLNAMAIDPSKIASNENLVYTPGEIVFKVKIYKKVKVGINKFSSGIDFASSSKRLPLIHHAALLMKEALGLKEGLVIEVDNSHEIRHAGLGSSSGLIASVACAINELYGNPISPSSMIQYLAQNHGEEIDGESHFISPVQCIGGSAAAGFFHGAFLILAGESRVIGSMNLDESYEVIIGIPKDFVELDSKALLEKEIASFDKFIKTGKKYGKTIAYRVLHQVFPAMIEGDLKTIGDLIFDYRYKMGSIENCSYAYPKLVSLTQKLAFLKTEGIADVLAISSVGPGIFAITKKIKDCKQAFEQQNLKIYLTKLQNEKYQVLERISL